MKTNCDCGARGCRVRDVLDCSGSDKFTWVSGGCMVKMDRSSRVDDNSDESLSR